jgi:hypothetical protein
MWSFLRSILTGRRTSRNLPPAVALIDGGAEVRFYDVPQWRIQWHQVQEIAVQVTVIRECDYAEAFWDLTGEGLRFGCPVELVMGSDAFNAAVFAFQGFDHEVYREAREAEAAMREGRFICWQKEPGPTKGST